MCYQIYKTLFFLSFFKESQTAFKNSKIIVSLTRSIPAEFLAFYSLFNFYLFTMAYMYTPLSTKGQFFLIKSFFLKETY